MSNKVKLHRVLSLPQDADNGSIYYLSDGTQYLGLSSGDFLKISDIVFTNTLNTFGQLNKIYIHNDNVSTTLKIWNGLEYVTLGDSEPFDASMIENEINNLNIRISNLENIQQNKVVVSQSEPLDLNIGDYWYELI